MDKTNKNWERIESVVRWSGMTVNRFAIHIGLSRSENLYQIKNGNNGISQKLAQRIVEVFPEISIGWLMTGEGFMLKEKNAGFAIPCYVGVGSLIELSGGACVQPEWMISFPLLDNCDMALQVPSDAVKEPQMSEITLGKTYFLKKTSIKEIIPDANYVIIAQNCVYLRKIRTSEEWLILSVEGCGCAVANDSANAGGVATTTNREYNSCGQDNVGVDGSVLDACDVVKLAVADVVAIYRLTGVYSDI